MNKILCLALQSNLLIHSIYSVIIISHFNESLDTSGTTGTPKGIVRDTGGTVVALHWTLKNIFNIDKGEVFFAASDIGWVVGHSFIVYGPLIRGATSIIFEGKPVIPNAGVLWRMVE
jgi:propionyl-CoA synthetase